MLINYKKELDAKIKEYLDNLFANVEDSQQLFDLKEELKVNLKEKISDYKRDEDMDETEAFNSAIISLGDMTGLVKEMQEIGGKNNIKQIIHQKNAKGASVIGIIIGSSLTLFSLALIIFLNYILEEKIAMYGVCIFIVMGVPIINYNLLRIETAKKYSMSRGKAFLFSLGTMFLLFTIYLALVISVATEEPYFAIIPCFIFLAAAIGIYVSAFINKVDRRKK